MTDKKKKFYRVSFSKTGCGYGRCFDTKVERDKFAERQKLAGFSVITYES